MYLSKGKLNMAIVCRWSFPNDNGGVAMHNWLLNRALKNEMHVSFICLKVPNQSVVYNKTDVRALHFSLESFPKLYSVFRGFFLRRLLRTFIDLHVSWKIFRILSKEKFQVVEFMDIHSEGFFTLMFRRFMHIKPKIVVRSHTPWLLLKTGYHNLGKKSESSFLAKLSEKFCFQLADAITTPSNHLRNELISRFPDLENKINAIPNIVDVDHFGSYSKASCTLKGFTFLHVGRFEAAKGVITLIKAFCLVSKKLPGVKLVNVGSPRGEALQECLNLLKDASLEERVTFTGYVPYENLPSYYQMSNAVIVSAEIYESFSYTVAQAMAAGRHVILSDSGGMPETVNYGQFGSIYPVGDYEALAKQMELAIGNPIFKRADSIKFCTERYSGKVLGPVYFDFYSKLNES